MRPNPRHIAIVSSLAIAATAGADIVATCTVDGETQNLAATFENGVFTLTPGTYQFAGGTVEITTHFGARTPDAQIAYGLATSDFGAPSVFGFVFSAPFMLDAGPFNAETSIVGGLTDFNGNGVSLDPDAFPKIQRLAVNGGSPATALLDVGDAFSAGAGSAGAVYNYGPFSIPPTLAPAGTWSLLELHVSYVSSGDGDITALTGFGRVEVVPAPGAALLATLATLGAVRRRRRH